MRRCRYRSRTLRTTAAAIVNGLTPLGVHSVNAGTPIRLASSTLRSMRGQGDNGGRCALLLHSHMPYVEGFDTWPFGEEWLWEAVATSYLPVLDVLDDTGAPVTVSLTPVLCDQLAAPGAIERCLAFIRDIRPAAHEIDLADAPPELRAPLEHSAAVYMSAADQLAARPDVLGRFAPFASWTSSATHAVLPLLATDAGVR